MASRVRIACGVSAAVLSLAGCVSMPSSGPPSSLKIKQADAGQSQNYAGLYPQPPQPDWSPQEVVQGFLFANESYYTATDVVEQYLTPRAQRTWKPGSSVSVFESFKVSGPTLVTATNRSQQATVSVSGLVRAGLNGSGQQLYASAQGNSADAQPLPSGPPSCPALTGKQCSNTFTLDKVNGQWRIAGLPDYLLLDETSFDRAWAPQDLYFFDTAKHVLVPDSVFVPIGTGETDLLKKLAGALRSGPPDWLSGATINVFPGHVTSVDVTVDPPTAVVNLRGPLSAADWTSLPYVAAELVWTLTGASPIAGVQLEVNGIPQGSPMNRSSTFAPYPSGYASFTFVGKNGVPQSLCGSTKNPPAGPGAPIFGHLAGGEVIACNESAASSPPSSSASPTASASTAATQRPNSRKSAPGAKPGGKGPGNKPPETNAPANLVDMVAVSPDGKYIAEVSSNGNELSMGPLAGHAALKTVGGIGTKITSISWSRQDDQDDLWLTQNENVWMVSQTLKATQVPFGGDVTALSVAPDGVRVAMIVQDTQGNQTSQQLLLASVNPSGSQTSQQTQHVNRTAVPAIGVPQVPLGPGITNAEALTWYDADDLIVLAPSGESDELQEVPVDGRASTQNLAPLQPSPGEMVSSIAAGNGSNVVVAGLSDGKLEVSAGLEGPWEILGPGSAPAYLIQPAPITPPYLDPAPPAK